MAQQGGSGNNEKTPTRPPIIGGRNSTPPRNPRPETPQPPPTPVTPPPQPSTTLSIGRASTSGSKRPMSSPGKTITKSSCICPVCGKEMYHDKALNGHIRWHPQKDRDAAAERVARALASSVVVVQNEQGNASKRHKLPDLNLSPPPEDEE